jgi:hypothetical protein
MLILARRPYLKIYLTGIQYNEVMKILGDLSDEFCLQVSDDHVFL